MSSHIYEGPPPDPPPVVNLPIVITDENAETFNYAEYDWLVAVGVRRQLHEMQCEDGKCRHDLDFEEFTDLQNNPTTQAQTFTWLFDYNGMGFFYRHKRPFNDGRRREMMDKYPERIREFLATEVAGALDDIYRIVNKLYKFVGWQRHIPTKKFSQQADRVIAPFVIYMYLLPDGTVRYGYDQVGEDEDGAFVAREPKQKFKHYYGNPYSDSDSDSDSDAD